MVNTAKVAQEASILTQAQAGGVKDEAASYDVRTSWNTTSRPLSHLTTAKPREQNRRTCRVVLRAANGATKPRSCMLGQQSTERPNFRQKPPEGGSHKQCLGRKSFTGTTRSMETRNTKTRNTKTGNTKTGNTKTRNMKTRNMNARFHQGLGKLQPVRRRLLAAMIALADARHYLSVSTVYKNDYESRCANLEKKYAAYKRMEESD